MSAPSHPLSFSASPGDPNDACPNCGISRKHAGNPDACGGNWCKPGCFDPDAATPAEKMRRLAGFLEAWGVHA